MRYKPILFILTLLLGAGAAYAVDFGGHVGYFGNDIQKAYLGVDLMAPIGPVVIVPNFDYSKAHGLGYWWANGDVAFRFSPSGSGSTFWLGAGPSYEFLTGTANGVSGGYGTISTNQYGGGGSGGGSGGSGGGSGGSGGGSSGSGSGQSSAFTFDNGMRHAWGYDVTGGVAFSGHLRPYVQAHYNKIRNFKTAGVAVGFRFGH